MFFKKSNKAFSIHNVLEVQQKLFGFNDFDHGNRKNRKKKTLRKSKNIQSKFDVGDYKDPEIKISEKYSNKYYIDENGVLGSINPFCPHCHSRKVTQWGLYSKNVISEEYCGNIPIQRYYCKKCGKTFITDLNEHFDFYSNISNSLKDKACEVKELNQSSLRDIAKYYEIFYGIRISYETIRKVLIVIEGNEIDYNIGNLSGYYGYDAQWIKINKIWRFRHAIYDLVQRMPVAELFAEEESNKDVYDFINKYIAPKDRIAIVTDTKPGYDVVMNKLNFERHQYCIFHFKKNLNKQIRSEIQERKQKIINQLKEEYENKSESFYNDEADEALMPFKKEIRYALQLTYYIFKEESFDKAESYIQLIKSNMINFPEFIREYIEEKFLPYYKSYIGYLEKPYKGKLDDTNNKTEGYFRSTMPKGQKRKYRTLTGVINQVYHRGNGLIKNQREKKKNEKPKRFVR